MDTALIFGSIVILSGLAFLAIRWWVNKLGDAMLSLAVSLRDLDRATRKRR